MPGLARVPLYSYHTCCCDFTQAAHLARNNLVCVCCTCKLLMLSSLCVRVDSRADLRPSRLLKSLCRPSTSFCSARTASCVKHSGGVMPSVADTLLLSHRP